MYHWLSETPPETLTDIQRAARFFYLQKMSYGGKVAGQTFGTATTSPPRLNLLRIEEQLSAAHLRLSHVFVECLSWEQVFERYDRPHTLFFLDPRTGKPKAMASPSELSSTSAWLNCSPGSRGKPF
ncbi:MAG: hypothetical protein Tsb002_01120 [Wenzhouxiangellaceae bacterium]